MYTENEFAYVIHTPNCNLDCEGLCPGCNGPEGQYGYCCRTDLRGDRCSNELRTNLYSLKIQSDNEDHRTAQYMCIHHKCVDGEDYTVDHTGAKSCVAKRKHRLLL